LARFGEASTATGINGNQSDNSATDSGAAYVFVRDGSNWIQKAYLKASNTGAYDIFGYSVAVSRGTIVVGAPHEESRATGINGDQTDNGAAFTGAAYIFGPPTLLIAQSNENLRVSWPLWAADFVLEETPTLMATPIPWTQVSLPYQATDADISITVAMPTGNKFYRLRQR
jgi:FG-GAP repeat protein